MSLSRLHGNGTRLCRRGCGYRSVRGRPEGLELCPYHYVEANFGTKAAMRRFPEFKKHQEVSVDRSL